MKCLMIFSLQEFCSAIQGFGLCVPTSQERAEIINVCDEAYLGGKSHAI